MRKSLSNNGILFKNEQTLVKEKQLTNSDEE